MDEEKTDMERKHYLLTVTYNKDDCKTDIKTFIAERYCSAFCKARDLLNEFVQKYEIDPERRNYKLNKDVIRKPELGKSVETYDYQRHHRMVIRIDEISKMETLF